MPTMAGGDMALKRQLRSLMDVAQGEVPADLVVTGGRLVNVFTGEVQDNYSLAVKDGRVACVGPDLAYTIGPDTRVLDVGGRVVAPGLVEGHTHILRYSVREFARYAALSGTTAAVIETTEVGSVLGLEGIVAMLDAFRGQPIKLYATLSPLAALQPFMERIAPPLDDYRRLLQRDEVVGLGETYWGNLVRGDDRLLSLVAATLTAGKVAEGHTAGARGSRLAAYAAAGFSACHEPITAEEGLERLRLGMYFMARDGEIRQDLEAIAPIWRGGTVDLRRMCLVTDSIGPERMLDEGYLNRSVQKAIDLGLEPVRAIQMATLNVAEHFGLDNRIGSLAPGRAADIIVLPDLRTISPEIVISDGRIIVEEGRLLVEPRPENFPEVCFNTVRRPRPLAAQDFRIQVDSGGEVAVRAIRLVSHLVTQEATIEEMTVGGELLARPEADLLKVASLDRARGTGEMFVGLLLGYGLQRGALATSMAWDSQSMIVVGADDLDMALAASRLLETGGGAVVAVDGKTVAEFAAPVAGVMSLEPMATVASAVGRVKRVARELGCRSPDPILTADVLSTAAIPHLRITDRGYVRVKDGRLVGLMLAGD